MIISINIIIILYKGIKEMRPKISQSLIVLKSKDEKTRDEKTLDRIRNDVMNLQREIN